MFQAILYDYDLTFFKEIVKFPTLTWKSQQLLSVDYLTVGYLVVVWTCVCSQSAFVIFHTAKFASILVSWFIRNFSSSSFVRGVLFLDCSVILPN